MADHDVIVIGAGVAGLTAGLVAASHGLSTLVIDRIGVGGQVVNIEHIENFPGFPDGISGIELGPALQEQAETAGAAFLLDEVTGLDHDGAEWTAATAGGEQLSARAVVLATGSRLRKLGIPAEDKFVGRGVSNCASCDGPFFRGEHVVVAGGGDSAVQEALVLASLAGRVTIVHDGPRLTAQPILTGRLPEHDNISLRANTTVRELQGDDGLRTVVLSGPDGDEEVEAGGLFVFVGLDPNSELADGWVPRDGEGRLPVDATMQLDPRGLFAAGDVRAGSVCWLASASGDGATAAISVARYLATENS